MKVLCPSFPLQVRKNKFIELLPSHFLRFWKKVAETRLTLGLRAGSLFQSRCILVTLYTLLLCPKFWILFASRWGGGLWGAADRAVPYHVNFHEKQNVRQSSFLFSLRYTNGFKSHSPFIGSEVILSEKCLDFFPFFS